MFVVTRELYHTEMSGAVFAHMRDYLLAKEKNHCERVEFLPLEVMRLVCQELGADPSLQGHGVESYVLAEKANSPYEIESGALIEKRNRGQFGVLVAFIPQGLRLPAEDSYDIQTFKSYDLGGVLRGHVHRMIEALPAEGQEIARLVLTQTAVRRLAVNRHIKYLLALKNDGAGWEEAGAYLCYLNLIPDLALTKVGLETRIDRNWHCVDNLANAERSVLLGIDALVTEYGLDPEANDLRSHLVAYLRERDVTDTDTWLFRILQDDDIRRKVNFDKWKFKDVTAPGEVEVHLTPLEDPKTGALAVGLKKEGSNLIASTDPKSPVNLKWTTYPKKPENLGHYLIAVTRDTTEEQGSEELLRRTVKSGRTSLKLSLKDLDLEEGETCTAKIIIHAKDKTGVILSTDESESFWIEGQAQIPSLPKRADRIRNRAEAIFKAARKYRKQAELDSEGWEETPGQRYYRIKLKTRDVFRLAVNPMLYQVELANLANPLGCGVWKADIRDHPQLEMDDLQPVPVTAFGITSFPAFVEARRQLFAQIKTLDTAAVVEILDLREFKPEILAYTAAYHALWDELASKLNAAQIDGQVNNLLKQAHSLSRIDTVHCKFGTADETAEVLLLAPTHPLRLLWVAQYQELLYGWADKLDGKSEAQASEMVSEESINKIMSLNVPSSLAFDKGEVYVNTDNLDLFWSILPKGDTADVRKVVSQLLRLLGYRSAGEITSVTPTQVKDKIWRYLKHHPYVSTLRLNVINPGDGLLVLNAIRELQEMEEFKTLNYDVAFYGGLRYEAMGSAFDELTEEAPLTEGSHAKVDEALLKPNQNPLFPKLIFSKHRVREADWIECQVREAHITILIDRFATKVLTRPIADSLGSFCLHNLLAEYRADFDLRGDAATWSRKVVPNQNNELAEGAIYAKTLFDLTDALLRISACFYDWGNSQDKVPAIQLELSDIDKHIISQIHEHSDWVFTIDRNFGIEYFDNPRGAPGVNVRSYLIDYTPEFLDGIGHRLIISTFWLTEIEGLIQDGLRKMGIKGTGFHAAQILDVLKSISGKLALKLINNPNDAREIIGLALTRLLLEQRGDLKEGVLIPVDSHIGLFAEQRRQAANTELSLQRSDLILVRVVDGRLSLRLIEVKFRSGEGSPAEEFLLKQAIVDKNANTRKVLEDRFNPQAHPERLDREIQNQEFTGLLRFYFERCMRHGLIVPGSQAASEIETAIRQVEVGEFDLAFEKAGYIFNLRGVSKSPEAFQDNEIFVVGESEIEELLDIHEEDGAVMPKAQATTTVLTAADVPPAHRSDLGDEPSSQETLAEGIADNLTVTAESGSDREADGQVEVGRTQAVGPPDGAIQPDPATVSKIKPDLIRILFGKDCDADREIAWDPFISLPKKLANQHVLIVGKSGAGKTQTASVFVWELAKAGVPAVIFDFQGEYMSSALTNGAGQTFIECTQSQVLDAADGIRVNPLELPIDPYSGKNQNFMKVVYQVASSLARIFGLGDIQHAILRDAIAQAFTQNGFSVGDRSTWERPAPMLAQVWEILKHNEATMGGNVRNLNLRVQPFFDTGVFTDSLDAQGFRQVLKQTSIIRLSNLATPELMVAVSRFVLQKIYADMLAQGPTSALRVFAVVDEAHKLSYDETLTELIREARKYGVGILLASQSVKDFDRIVFDMVGTRVALQLEGEDARVMADNLGLVDKSDRDIARQLILNQPPHRAIIRSNHFEPYVQVNMMPFWQKRA